MKFLIHSDPFTAHMWKEMGNWYFWFPMERLRRMWNGKKWSIEYFADGQWRTEADMVILRRKAYWEEFGKYERRP